MELADLIFFREQLMAWFAGNHRPLPWKGEKDPYLIWLSEIILQQTRVEQGLPYFERFRRRFPRVEDLAAAPEDEVMKLWEGLGYYSRARNLHFTARQIASERNGRFPNNYKDMLALKGVGPYTAAAIASFAYDLPHAVVDGNVFRVLSRFFGIDTPIDTTAGKKQFGELAQRVLDQSQPGRYNQAIMDFGATQCTPQSPGCTSCPLRTRCRAFHTQVTDRLPVKQKKIQRRQRFFHYLVADYDGRVLIRKRTGKDIWRNLYEFPLVESPQADPGEDRLRRSPTWQTLPQIEQAQLKAVSRPFRQVLTHQVIVGTFWEVALPGGDQLPEEPYLCVEREQLRKFAFPKIIDLYLRDKSLYLKLL